ncbi:hypothetical protein E4T86_06910 [Mammaliicoccus sciuri]|uniref:condensation domain-containing protein n=1 Tax=Mammaliicoccus sciuri TaxID=1296 RepID=UPI001071F30A|nr:AMP-binding protein [Mammaliicoccus sciuri]MBF0773762.1 AMP-binding protein [Mammaliicoccus sciuri]TFU86457.1 hypothetical protein E4T86_06910 [Mammaliicoccus sciuri]
MSNLYENIMYETLATDEQKSIGAAYNTLENKEMYHIPFIVDIPHNVKKEDIYKYIKNIVDKHDILRTKFEIKESLYQIVFKDAELEIEEQNYDENGLFQKKAKNFINKPFDIENGPCFRLMIIYNKQNEEYQLLFVFHHLIFDGSSRNVLISELQSLIEGQSIENNDHYQYGDYSIWKKKKVNNKEEIKNYWKSKSKDISKSITLPGNFMKESKDGIYKSNLDEEFTNKIDSFCSEYKISRNLFILYGFSLTISKITSNDIPLCLPISERERTEFDDTIGLFLQTSLLIAKFDDSITLKESVEKFKRNYIDSFKYKDIPFEEKLSLLKINRNMKKSLPFFVNYEIFENSDLKVTDIDEEYAKFPFNLYVLDKGHTLDLRVSYSHKIFNQKFCEIAISQFKNVMSQILSLDKEDFTSTLKLNSDLDRDILPVPNRRIDYSKVNSLYMSLNNAFENFGDETAISQGNKKVSYKELKQIMLKTINFCNEITDKNIGVYGKRSIEYICIMLGTIMSGKTFVPLEIQSSDEKIKNIVRDANIKTIILIDELPIEGIEDIRYIDYSLKKIESQNSNILENIANKSCNQEAYIYFTSGSTGEPKGIIGKESSLVHFIEWQKNKFNISKADKFGQLVNAGFDVFLRDTLTPLISGAELVIPENTLDMSSKYLKEFLKKYKITTIHTVPSLAKDWLQNNTHGLSYLKRIFFAGEPLNYETVSNIQRNKSFTGEIINLYGPSETTLAKTYYVVPNTGVIEGVQPIGKPIDNTEILILNKENEMCGIFEEGEITVRTPFLSNGYLKDSPFVSNPYTNRKNDLLYKTGDFGKYNVNGLLEIVGRKDDQFKINGVKINKKEIENTLLKHESVNQAFVIKEESSSRNSLIAYIVTKEKFNKKDVRNFCRNSLHPSVIPNKFIILDDLPTNTNGKVDISKLPVYEMRTKKDKKLSLVETEILSIISRILEVKDINLEDDFFELGGHSLLVIQLINDIRETYNVELTFKEVFYNSLITELLDLINSRKKTNNQQSTLQDDSINEIGVTQDEIEELMNIYKD